MLQKKKIEQLQQEQDKQQIVFSKQLELYKQEKKDLEDQFQLLTVSQKNLDEKLQPLHEKYLKKEKILKEQQTLLSNENVKVFYKTLEKMLVSKFQASILLTSGLLQRSSVKEDFFADAAEYAVEAIFGFVAGMISVGTLGASTVIVGVAAAAAGAAAGKAAGVYVGELVDKKYENRAEEICSALNNPKHAWVVAELVARKISQHYIADLNQNSINENQKWAKKAAEAVYLFIASGKLKEKKCQTEDDMIKALIGILQENIDKGKNKKNPKEKGRCVIL